MEVLEYTAEGSGEPPHQQNLRAVPQGRPRRIPTGDFRQSGRVYTLLDIIKEDQTETDTKEHIEVITLKRTPRTWPRYCSFWAGAGGHNGGRLYRRPDPGLYQHPVEASARTSSHRVRHAHLSQPVQRGCGPYPKTTERGGRTLTLADVDWQEAATDYQDGYDLVVRYTATATYTGTATSKYATGYTVTADYKGM